jgi:hypothetical protein
MTFLSKVEDCFEISGRGCFIVPGVPRSGENIPHVQERDRIQLRTPDGRVIDTYVMSFSVFSGPKAKDCFPIRLPLEITKETVPIGTEVWHIG